MASEYIPHKGGKIIKETLILIGVFLLVITVIALLTYNPNDTNWLGENDNVEKISNGVGKIGAIISSNLFDVLGYCAYLLPLLFGYVMYRLFKSDYSLKKLDYYILSLRVLGFNLLILSACGLITKMNRFADDIISGGHLGRVVYNFISQYLGYDGSIIALIFAFVLGVPLFTGIPMLTICTFIGSATISAFNFNKTILALIRRFKGDSPKVDEANGYHNPSHVNDLSSVYKVVSDDVTSPIVSKAKNTPVENPEPVAPIPQMSGADSSTRFFKKEPIVDFGAIESMDLGFDKVDDSYKDYQQPKQTIIDSTSSEHPINSKQSSTIVTNTRVQTPNNSVTNPISNNSGMANANANANANNGTYQRDETLEELCNPSSTNSYNGPTTMVLTRNPTPNNQVNTNTNASNVATETNVAAKDNSVVSNREEDTKAFNANEVSSESSPVENKYPTTMVLNNSAEKDQTKITIKGSTSLNNDNVASTVNNVSLEKQVDLDFPKEVQSTNVNNVSAPVENNFNVNNSVNNNESINQSCQPELDKVEQEKGSFVDSPGPFEVPEHLKHALHTTNSKDADIIDFKNVKSKVADEEMSMLDPCFTEIIANPQITTVSDMLDKQKSSDIPFNVFANPYPSNSSSSSVSSSNINSSPVSNSNINSSPVSNSNISSGASSTQTPSKTQALSKTQDFENDLVPQNSNDMNNIELEPAQKEYSDGRQYIELDDVLPDSINYHGGYYDYSNADTSGFPSPEIFSAPQTPPAIDENKINELINLLDECLANLKIKARVADLAPYTDENGNIHPRKAYRTGPVITRFYLALDPNCPSKKIANASEDIARNLMMESIRVITKVPKTNYVAIEIPNFNRQTINMRMLLESEKFKNYKGSLAICLGRDIVNDPVIYDLAKAPHLLVAGTTGSGKSVGINTMLVSLLMKNTPKDLRLILIDPKMLEFSVYNHIPHLLTPVITDMKEVASALRWACVEMDRRYLLMSKLKVRDLTSYNEYLEGLQRQGKYLKDPTWTPSSSMDSTAPALEPLPRIVIVVDEFADLILQMKKQGDIEAMISRLAAKARACGMHLILATQSPRAEVITGTIRSNFPSQIAFKVKSGMESRIVLDEPGAEDLLGRGDMLVKYNDGSNQTVRAHGAFISDDEVNAFADAWRARGKPRYVDAVIQTELTEDNAMPGEKVSKTNGEDSLLDEIIEYCQVLKNNNQPYSVSLIQRKFGIGYNRSSRIADQLEEMGVISPPQGRQGTREILL